MIKNMFAFRILLALALALCVICSQASRLDQLVRPGCTVGIVSMESEIMDNAGLVGQLLELGSHDVLVYPVGRMAKNDQDKLQKINRRCIDWLIPEGLYHNDFVPSRSRNSRLIYLIGNNSNFTKKQYNSLPNLDDVALLFYFNQNQTSPLIKVLCPYFKEDTRYRRHRRVLISFKGELIVSLEDFYKIKAYQFCTEPGQGFYSGRQMGMMDTTVPQWKSLGTYEMTVDQEVIRAVGGRPLGLDIGVGEIALAITDGELEVHSGSSPHVYTIPHFDCGAPYDVSYAFIIGTKPGYAYQYENLWNTMDWPTWQLITVTVICLAATLILIGRANGIQGHRFDYFELASLAIRVIMAETSRVISSTASYRLSGILVKIMAAVTLPIMFYGFTGNLTKYIRANLPVRDNGTLPDTLDEFFELDKPLYGAFGWYLRHEYMYDANSKEGKLIRNIKKHDSSVSFQDMPKLVDALLNWSPVMLTGKEHFVMPEDAFMLVGSTDNLPIRDLYMLDRQDKDDSFHLDMVKEPFLYRYPSVCVKKYLDQGEEVLEAADKLIESGVVDKLKYNERARKPKSKYVALKREHMIRFDCLFFPTWFVVIGVVTAVIFFIVEVIFGTSRARSARERRYLPENTEDIGTKEEDEEKVKTGGETE